MVETNLFKLVIDNMNLFSTKSSTSATADDPLRETANSLEEGGKILIQDTSASEKKFQETSTSEKSSKTLQLQ